MGRGDGGAVADGLGGVFVGACGGVVGAVNLSEYVSLASEVGATEVGRRRWKGVAYIRHCGLDAVGGDEAIVSEVLDEGCVCCAGAAPGHGDASMPRGTAEKAEEIWEKLQGDCSDKDCYGEEPCGWMEMPSWRQN